MSRPEIGTEYAADTGTGLARAIIEECRARGWTLGTAESLTGGLVAAELICVPGASDVVRGGIVAYAVDLKESVLGVSADVLARHGAVSRECAEAMASGARGVLGVDVVLATTGVAGPDPSEGHPPGAVHLAVRGPDVDGEEVGAHRALTTRGTRSQIRNEATAQGLSLLLATIQTTPPAAPSHSGGVL